MEYAAGCSGCSRDAVRSLVDRVGDAAHCACSPMSENWRTKDQLDCGGNDGGRPKSRHGERRGCAVNACEGLGGPAVMTGAVMRPGQLRKGHWSLANLDNGGQLSYNFLFRTSRTAGAAAVPHRVTNGSCYRLGFGDAPGGDALTGFPRRQTGWSCGTTSARRAGDWWWLQGQAIDRGCRGR